MLNMKAFSLPALNSFSFLTYPSTQSYNPQPFTRLYESIFKKQPHASETNYDWPSAQKITTCNNMNAEVQWFQSQLQFQAFVKIAITFAITFAFYMAGICSIEVFLCIAVVSTLLLGIQHGVFSSVPLWVRISLFVSSFILANQIFLTVLNLISPRNAEILYSSRFSLIASLLISVVLCTIYGYRRLIFNRYELNCRSLNKCLSLYPPSLLQCLTRTLQLKWTIIQIYSLCFLALYILVAVLAYDYILMNGKAYISLLHPLVFIAQFVTIGFIVIVWHAVQYFVNGTLFWRMLSLYNLINSYTKIPHIVQLLDVSLPWQTQHDLNMNPSLRVSQSINSSPQSKIQNSLTPQVHKQLSLRSLSWLIKLLTYRQDDLNSKIMVYSAVGCNRNIGEFRDFVMYWDYLVQFALKILPNVNKDLNRLMLQAKDLQIKKQQSKQIIQDLLYYPKIILKQCQIEIQALECANQLQICDYLLEIISTCDVNLAADTGKSTRVLTEIKQFNRLCSLVGGVDWLAEIITNRMQNLFNKSERIINKMNK